MTLELKHLSVNIQNRAILRDVSVSFDTGLTYLVGLNGCGKTTLLRSIAQLRPYQGSIQLNHQILADLRPRALARKLALVPQHLNIPFRFNVYDFVLMGRFPYLNWLGNYQPADHQAVAQQLEALSITDLRDRYLDEISGGELQKVCIARALCQETPVLILDEPSQSLDPLNKLALYEILEALAETGKTLICATHDLEPLESSSARVVGMKNGQVVLNQQGGNLREQLMEEVYR